MLAKIEINIDNDFPLSEFNTLVDLALKLEASDIHIHVDEQNADIFLRIFGNIYCIGSVQKAYINKMLAAAFNTLSVSGSGDSAFHFGKIQQSILRLDSCSLRLQTVPNYPNGYSAFYRIIRNEVAVFATIEKLSYSEETSKALVHALTTDYGLIAVSGRANDGKSTTLQACVRSILKKKGFSNIFTIESPPEIKLDHVTQIPIHEAPGMTEQELDDQYTDLFKTLLRVDPNVIVPTEVRSPALLSLLEKAVTTGSKVITTIHSTGVINMVARLLDMGMSQLNLGTVGFFSLLLYQKLLPKNCVCCSFLWKDRPDICLPKRFLDSLATIDNADHTAIRIYNPEGCDKCNYIGFNGRVLVSEFLSPDLDILSSIYHHGPKSLPATWLSLGYIPIRLDALRLVVKGTISPEIFIAHFG